MSDAMADLERFVSLARKVRRDPLQPGEKKEFAHLNEHLRGLIAGARPAPKVVTGLSRTGSSASLNALPQSAPAAAEEATKAPSSEALNPEPNTVTKETVVVIDAEKAKKLNRVGLHERPASMYQASKSPIYLASYYEDYLEASLSAKEAKAPARVVNSSGEEIKFDNTTMDLWNIGGEVASKPVQEASPPPQVRVKPGPEIDALRPKTRSRPRDESAVFVGPSTVDLQAELRGGPPGIVTSKNDRAPTVRAAPNPNPQPLPLDAILSEDATPPSDPEAHPKLERTGAQSEPQPQMLRTTPPIGTLEAVSSKTPAKLEPLEKGVTRPPEPLSRGGNLISDEATQLDPRNNTPSEATQLNLRNNTPSETTQLNLRNNTPSETTQLNLRNNIPSEATQLDPRNKIPSEATQLDPRNKMPSEATQLDPLGSAGEPNWPSSKSALRERQPAPSTPKQGTTSTPPKNEVLRTPRSRRRTPIAQASEPTAPAPRSRRRTPVREEPRPSTSHDALTDDLLLDEAATKTPPAVKPTLKPKKARVLPAIVHLRNQEVVKGGIGRFDGATGEIELSIGKTGDVRVLALAEIVIIVFGRSKGQPKTPRTGTKLKITLKDGRLLRGMSADYEAGRSSFNMVPLDEKGGVDKIWVPLHSVEAIVAERT